MTHSRAEAVPRVSLLTANQTGQGPLREGPLSPSWTQASVPDPAVFLRPSPSPLPSLDWQLQGAAGSLCPE